MNQGTALSIKCDCCGQTENVPLGGAIPMRCRCKDRPAWRIAGTVAHPPAKLTPEA